VSHSDFVTRGQALVSSGQYQEAVKVCRLGLLGRPTTVEGRVVLGQALLALKRHDEVLAEMRVALELDHTSIAAQALRGEALLRKGDGHGALEVFLALRSQGRADARVAELIAEAERMLGRAPSGNVSHPAVDFIAQDPTGFGTDIGTKHYPAHLAENALAGGGGAEGGGEYTRPTSLSPAPKRRSQLDALSPFDVRRDATPPPAVLAVGDRSGTVEVDPDIEGLEVRSDDDLGEVVGPPVATGPDPDAVTMERQAMRGSVKKSSRSGKSSAPAAASKPNRSSLFKEEISTVELDDDEMLEVDDTLYPEPRRMTAKKVPGPGTAVRNAVKMPSGPLDQPLPAATRPTAMPLAAQQAPGQLPAQLAPMGGGAPHAMGPAAAGSPPLQPMPLQPMPLQPMPLQPMPQPHPMAMPQPHPMAMPQPHPMAMPMQPHALPPLQLQPMPQMSARGPIASALPTAAAAPMPPHSLQQMPLHPMQPQAMPPMQLSPSLPVQQPMQLPSNHAAFRPTIAVQPAGPDAMYNGRDAAEPAWARATVMPGGPGGPAGYGQASPDDPTRLPHEIDPRIAAMLINPVGEPTPPSAFAPEASSPSHRAGTRRGRSRLQIAVWVLIGTLVIGGGVFAGFQIRALRLHKQIAAERSRAVALAKADTWPGWRGARDSLSGIAQASPTSDNKAALARARALLAYEFGDGAADAKAAVERLAGQSSLDVDLAIAHLALARGDVKAAREAAERAQQSAPDDAAALYASGQAALLSGDARGAVAELRRAYEREARPLYAVALARALAAGSSWDDALAAVDRAPDNPAAVIAKAQILVAAGRSSGGPAGEIRAQLGKLIADGPKPAGDQGRVASPMQVALADLALAQVELARGDAAAARAALLASLALNVNEQRFAEEFGEAAYALGDLDSARKAAIRALEAWPASRRARTTLAQVWLALGKPTTSLELLTKAPDAAAWPKGQTVRGLAKLAIGDTEAARADLDAALKKNPGFEPALIARAWLDLANGELDEARQRIEARFSPKGASTAMVAVYAAILRSSGDPAARDKAKGLLERALAGPPNVDTPRAQLELARIHRDLGDVHGARAAYAEASRTGNFDARLESGLLWIEDHDPSRGRATLEQLLKDSSERPPASLLLEVARARMLMGDHPGAAEALAAAEKAGAPRWHLGRERGRLALRKDDTAAAAAALVGALDGCGADVDTFLLAADTVSADDKQAALAQKLRTLYPTRLKGRPEVQIIEGKLALAGERRDEAEKLYRDARDALAAEKASSRRLAQADFGRAVVAYFKEDDPTAASILALVIFEDPSIYTAYLFAAEIYKTKRNFKKALELAQHAAAFNPDWIEAWKFVGAMAAQVGNRKLVDDAIQRVGELAPGSDALRELKQLR
jgi:predicted Zn-dependent protease